MWDQRVVSKSKLSITWNIKIVLYLETSLFERAGNLLGRRESPDLKGLRFRRVRPLMWAGPALPWPLNEEGASLVESQL